MAFGKTPKRKSPKELREAERKHAKRVALKALRKARKIAETSGVKLSDWEGEFLGSVEQRLKMYGRAFGDPEKGSPSSSLSIRQSVKVKEIVAKASGKPRKSRFRRRAG
ncbi:MAG TPA: hypothetical protein VLT91_06825 [Rhizomicrobium sp.]|nr:hypothetical protein [Rhizomicrobium sp.]